MQALVDIGNSKIKLAICKNGELMSTHVFDQEEEKNLIQQLQNPHIEQGIVAATGELPSQVLTMRHLIILNAQTPLPFQIQYKTPDTLGADRIALAAAAQKTFLGKHVLIIDAGTCLTTDFLHKDGIYLGGTISPGLRVRLKSLHTFTARLPLLKQLSEKEIPLVGSSTKESIESGVFHGIVNEIDGMIKEYESLYENLTVILTGGDAKWFANHVKSKIFASPNLMWTGLMHILDHNRRIA